jgi:hypothetical protein
MTAYFIAQKRYGNYYVYHALLIFRGGLMIRGFTRRRRNADYGKYSEKRLAEKFIQQQ